MSTGESGSCIPEVVDVQLSNELIANSLVSLFTQVQVTLVLLNFTPNFFYLMTLAHVSVRRMWTRCRSPSLNLWHR